MTRTLWEVFRSILRRNTTADDKESEEESEGFVPSLLDLSVRYSHGGPDDEIDREFRRIDAQARELEEEQRQRDR